MELILIRGLPGSGKSTYAKKMGCFHIEADMYHCKDGKYEFDSSRAILAHKWCQKMTMFAMEQGIDVAVSNTFTQAWEIKPYLDMAAETGHRVKIIRMSNDYGSVHNIPAGVMQKTRERFENIAGEEIKYYVSGV